MHWAPPSNPQSVCNLASTVTLSLGPVSVAFPIEQCTSTEMLIGEDGNPYQRCRIRPLRALCAVRRGGPPGSRPDPSDGAEYLAATLSEGDLVTPGLVDPAGLR